MSVAVAGASGVPLSSVPQPSWIPSGGAVDAVAVQGNTAYLGGTFSYVGPQTGSFVALDSGSGSLLPNWPTVGGDVLASAPDGSGGWFVGGDFSTVGTEATLNDVHISNLVHIRSNGSIDPFQAVNGEVDAIAIAGDIVYVGGSFTTAGGGPRTNVAAFDEYSGDLMPWDPEVTGPDSFVSSIAVSGSTVYVGGSFSTVNGSTQRSNVAALSATTGLATAWNPGVDADVDAIALSGSTVFLGGSFATVDGSAHQGLAALDSTSGALTSWDASAQGPVYALALSGTTLYVGGDFATVNGDPSPDLASFNINGTGAATGWAPGIDGEVDSLAVSGSTVYAGGSFRTANKGSGLQAARDNIAGFDAASGNVLSFDPVMGGAVETIGVSGSTVYAGGVFQSVGGVRRSYLAALDLTTGQATSWDPEANSAVNSLAVSGSTIYAGGYFTLVNGSVGRNYLAAFDAGTGTATSWNPSPDDDVQAVAVAGGVVYAGGDFKHVNGTTARNRLGAFDTNGTATSWNPGADGTVLALTVAAGTIYAGGAFVTVNGSTTRRHLAALDATTGTATSWDPNVDGDVFTVAVANGVVYAGGSFSTVNGSTTRNNLAAFDPASAIATSWDPEPDDYVAAILPSGSSVFVAGGFTTVNGSTHRSYLAELDSTTGTAAAWNPGADSDAFVLAPTSGGLVAGGSFTAFSLGATYQAGLAPFNAQSAPGAPTDLVALPGDGEATLIFTPPASDGGSPITSYTATASPGGAQATLTNISFQPAIVVHGLTDNVAYTFTVTASNAIGTGEASVPSAAVTPAVGAIAAHIAPDGYGFRQIFIATAIVSDRAFDSYVEYGTTPAFGSTCCSGGFGQAEILPNGTMTLSNLQDGTTYYIRLVVSNGVNTVTSNTITMSTVTSTAPLIEPTDPPVWIPNCDCFEVTPLVATEGYDTAWELDAGTSPGSLSSVGGGSFGAYDAGGYTYSSGVTVQVPFPRPTVMYVQLKATNVKGTTTSSIYTVPIPGPPAVAPTNVSAVGHNGFATVSFTPIPTSPGDPPITYLARSSPGNFAATSSGSPIAVNGLTNGVSYTFTVTASNGSGLAARPPLRRTPLHLRPALLPAGAEVEEGAEAVEEGVDRT